MPNYFAPHSHWQQCSTNDAQLLNTIVMTQVLPLSYFNYSSFCLHCPVHYSSSIVDTQVVQVPMALASILIEHCSCSLHPFYQPDSSASVALLHVFGVGRIVCLSSAISLGISLPSKPWHAEDFPIYGSALHRAVYQDAEAE
jgi:hypothetical protein